MAEHFDRHLWQRPQQRIARIRRRLDPLHHEGEAREPHGSLKQDFERGEFRDLRNLDEGQGLKLNEVARHLDLDDREIGRLIDAAWDILHRGGE